MEIKWLAFMVIGVMFAATVMFWSTDHSNSEQMKSCVASPGHSWVQKSGDYYECVPDSEANK